MTEQEQQALVADLETQRAKLETLLAEAKANPGADRRALILAALGGIAAATALAPKDAAAQANQNDVFQATTRALENTILPVLRAQFDLLSAAFSVLGALGVPGEFMQMIRCMLGSLGGLGFNFNACAALGDIVNGPNQLLRTGNIRPAIDRIWHETPVTTAVDMDVATADSFFASRDQAEGSQTVTAALSEGQDALGEIDSTALDELNAAAEAGSLITVMAKIGQLIYGTNQRLAMVIQAQNAQQQILSALLMVPQHHNYLAVADRAREATPTRIPIPGAQGIGTGTGFGDVPTVLAPGG